MHPTRREEVFIDAGFWIAFMRDRDSHHREANDLWQREVNGIRRPITTNWTLHEALTYFNSRQRNRHDLAVELLEFVGSTTEIEIIDAAQYERQALAVFRAHVDKRWSVADCASFVCIRARGAACALSFDRDFAQAQYEFNFTTLRMGDDSR